MNLKELREQLKKLLLAAKAILEAAEKDAKGPRDLTAEERVEIQKHLEEAAKVKEKIKELEGDEALRKQVAEMGAGLELLQMRTPPSGSGGTPSGKGRTVGEQFVNAPQWQQWLKQIAPSGQISEGLRGLMSPPVEFRSLFGRKDLITGADDTSAGAFVVTDTTGIYEPLGRAPLRLRDMISIRQTTSDLVEFVRQTAIVQQAAPVAEANVTDFSGGTGEVSGEKPEAMTSFEKVQAAVKTIAVWIPATKRALSDAAQIRGIIDQELQDDIAEELEDQIVNGDGVGENYTGILNTAGILLQAWDTDLLTTTRRAKTTLRLSGRAIPTAWLINPADWETIELLQDGNNRYYWGGPLTNGQPQLWGVPIVECEAIAEGTAILGDFRKAVMWDRERASIQVSDSHADFFIRNMVAILCEMRAAFGLVRPSGFIVVDMAAGS
jgi:HK97 family phage major capsid protein